MSVCRWIFDFLQEGSQSVKVGSRFSNSAVVIVMSTVFFDVIPPDHSVGKHINVRRFWSVKERDYTLHAIGRNLDGQIDVTSLQFVENKRKFRGVSVSKISSDLSHFSTWFSDKYWHGGGDRAVRTREMLVLHKKCSRTECILDFLQRCPVTSVILFPLKIDRLKLECGRIWPTDCCREVHNGRRYLLIMWSADDSAPLQ